MHCQLEVHRFQFGYTLVLVFRSILLLKHYRVAFGEWSIVQPPVAFLNYLFGTRGQRRAKLGTDGNGLLRANGG